MSYISATGFLVVPCYNEELRIAPADYWKYLENQGLFVIFVNDGSADETSQRCKSFGLTHATVLDLPSNQGKANALRQGILLASANSKDNQLISIIDADGAFDKEEVIRIIELAAVKLNNMYDALFTSRVKLAGREISRNPVRHMIGRAISALFATAGLRLPYDTQSGLKVFKMSSGLAEAFQEPFETRWFMEIELIIRMMNNQHRLCIWEEPLLFWNETKGSKVVSIRSIGIIFQVLKLVRRMKEIKARSKV